MQRLNFQLKNFHLGTAMQGSGGKVLVTPAGKQVKAILRNDAGAAASNPMTPTAGHIATNVDNVAWGQLLYTGQTANFTAGQIITGAQSGATGVLKVQSDAGTTGTLTMVGITGAFLTGEALSDPLGGNGVANGGVVNGISNVDLFIQTPDGQFITVGNVSPLSLAEVFAGGGRNQCMCLPFSIYDTSATTETNTGFTEPVGALFLPTPAIYVVTTDAGQTIDVGTDSSGGANDADGFIDSPLLTTAGLVKASLIASADTMGALFSVLDSANSGDDAPEGKVSQSESITYTLDASTDTGEGYFYLPYVLMSVPFAVGLA